MNCYVPLTPRPSRWWIVLKFALFTLAALAFVLAGIVGAWLFSFTVEGW